MSADDNDDDFTRLKALLLTDDRQQQADLAKRLAELEAAQSRLPKTLPQTIELADRSGPRLGRSLLKPVAAALTALARSDKQLFVSVLFPVIGPIIRRAIADAMATLMRNLNRTLELSLSWRSVRWRLEARRSGVPFAQIVLKHTLAYRIEHLLWIEEGSGLLLAHATNSDAPIADRDAIAGMLTAISDFVRDAVLARPDEALHRVELGEFSVRLLRTPHAYLAAVVRGEPGERVLDALRLLSEQLHEELGPEPRSYSEAAEAVLVDWLLQSGQSEALLATDQPAGGGKRFPWKPVLAVAVLLAGIGWLSWRGVVRYQHRQQLLAVLAAQPGIRLAELELDGKTIHVRGQRDPLALDDQQLATLMGVPATDLQTDWTLQHSTEPAILARRLQSRLAAPASVQISADPAGLSLRGNWPDPPADLDLKLEAYRALLPVDDSQLQRTHSAPPPAFDPQAWQQDADRQRVRFDGGASDAAADAQVARLAQLLRAAQAALPGARFRVLGGSDGTGSVAINTQLRLARARWLFDRLQAAGIDPATLTLDEQGEQAVDADADARSARVQLISPR